MTKDTVIIRKPDGTKEIIELTDENFTEIESGKGGKPSILMRISNELVSTAPGQKQ